MASFNNLPNELVLEIIRLLFPEDLESFSSTCRLVHELAIKFLDEHRKLKKEYRNWVTDPFESYRCLFVLLREILENPRIALYVEGLKIQELYEGWESGAEAVSESKIEVELDSGLTEASQKAVSRDDELAKFRKAIQECDYLSAEDVEDWWEVLKNGYDDVVLALLVTVLPNFKRLDIQFDPYFADRFLETIQRISTDSSTSNSSTPLSRLEVTMEQCYAFIDFRYPWPFFALPWMRFVAGICIDHSEMITLPERCTNVIQMNWVQPFDLTPEKTKNLFGIFKALQVFRLLPELTTNCDVVTIRDSLILYAKHTLTELSLYIDDLDYEYEVDIGDLRAFEVLRKVEISANSLLGGRESSRRTLAEVLPTSIEDVTIQDYMLPRQEYRSLVFDLLSVKNHSLPNMKRLSFQETFFNPCVVITEDDDLKMECQKAGFVLVISRDVQSGYGCFKI